MFRYGILLALCVLVLTGCANNDARAADYAAEVARDIADRYDSPGGHPLPAEYLASQIVERDELLNVEMLDWAGDSGGSEGARLDVRITVTLPETEVASGWLTLPPSQSTRCWSITVSSRIDALRTTREFPCPSGATARLPDPEPLPELPPDIEAVLVEALEGATAATAEKRVAALFPPEGYTIRVEAAGGVVVVALGAPAVRDCAVAVIDADGLVTVRTGFSRDALLPGEAGCSPALLRWSPGA